MYSFFSDLQDFLNHNTTGIIVVTGPTCSGKTGMSIEIAKQYNGEIINADSRQIFQDIPITTAAPTIKEQGSITHHLFQCVPPHKPITVADWKQKAEQKIQEIHHRKKIPIVCGGTGLYINALTKNFSFGIPENETLRNTLETLSHQQLWEMLYKKEPQKAKNTAPQNKKYIIRALEIHESLQNTGLQNIKNAEYASYIIGTTLPRSELYTKINSRVEYMFQQGFLEEIDALIKKYPDIPQKDSGFVAHGIPEALRYKNGEISQQELIDKMQQNTRKYAKRQLTWWRKDERVQWIHGSTGEKIDINHEIF